MASLLTALFIALTAAVLSGVANAEDTQHVKISVFLESVAKPQSTVWVAFRQAIQPHWHTYWKNPGDSGLATEVTWTLPKGVSAGEIEWPTPERFVTNSIVNFGYANEATFLVPLRIGGDALIGKTRAKLSWLACAEMCVPEEASVEFDLRAPRGNPEVFAKARAALPRVFNGTVQATYDQSTISLNLTGKFSSGTRAEKVTFYPATADAIDYAAPLRAALKGNTLTLTLARPKRAHALSEFSGVLGLPGIGAFDVSTNDVTPIALPQTPQGVVEASSFSGFAGAAFLAFLGGLILNLMPCVLPILSMKALALAKAGSASREQRRDGIRYFAGVMATFGIMGGALVALRLGGAAIGWGFQLQSPIFVLALALLMAAIGLNLFDIFELPLSLAGIGDRLTRTQDGRGAFFTGALAVSVASPCTAPFMGAALGYALTQQAATAIGVFLALGVGFALPFTALAFTPALMRLIPKPGPWMVRFKELLAFPMFATAIWLLWVLIRQTGPVGLVIALCVALGAVFLLWLLPLLAPIPRIGSALAGIAALAVLTLDLRSAAMHSNTNVEWARWSPQAVTEAQRNGRVVLVDFSAAWCVTCLVNEQVALSDSAVRTRLAEDGVVTLKGDWTNRNSAIAAELGRLGRAGVPLYLLYPAHLSAPPTILPQLLTPRLVLRALDNLSR